ncbi:MAG: hypothetical protein ABSD20_20070 [Terriglobales bacterium]
MDKAMKVPMCDQCAVYFEQQLKVLVLFGQAQITGGSHIRAFVDLQRRRRAGGLGRTTHLGTSR